MQRDQEITLWREREPCHYAGCRDQRLRATDNFENRVAGDEDPRSRNTFAQQILPAALGIRHQYVAAVIDHPPIDLLRYAIVETAVSRLHVENRYVEPLGYHHAQAAVGIAQHEQAIGLFSS